MRRMIIMGLATLGLSPFVRSEQQSPSAYPPGRDTCSVCERRIVSRDGRRSIAGLRYTIPDDEPILRELFPELKAGSYEVCPLCFLRAFGIKV